MNLEVEIAQKKRGRKKKEVTIPNNSIVTSPTIEENITISLEESNLEQPNTEPVAKKRGRKPKGGKLISKQQERLNTTTPVANVILHLKCSIQDLNEHNNVISQLVNDPLVYNPTVPPSIMTYNDNEKSSFSVYETNLSSSNNEIKNFAYSEFDMKQVLTNSNICQSCNLYNYTKILIMIKNPHVFGALMNLIIHLVIFQNMKWICKYMDMVHFAAQNVQ